jgi:hypothetical protein
VCQAGVSVPLNQEDHKSISTYTASLVDSSHGPSTISITIHQALYMKQRFPALHIPTNSPIYIFNNNQGMISTIQQHKGAYLD